MENINLFKIFIYYSESLQKSGVIRTSNKPSARSHNSLDFADVYPNFQIIFLVD